MELHDPADHLKVVLAISRSLIADVLLKILTEFAQIVPNTGLMRPAGGVRVGGESRLFSDFS